MRSAEDQSRGLSRWTITTGAWILAGFLLVTASLIFGGRAESRGFPSITNTKASGYAAFAELLRRDGYDVGLERSVRMDFRSADLVVSTHFSDYFWDDQSSAGVPDPQGEDTEPGYVRALEKYTEGGGTVLSIQSRQDFEFVSNAMSSPSRAVSSRDFNEGYNISVPFGGFQPEFRRDQSIPYTAWYVRENSYVTYMKSGDGLIVTVADGLPVTNRFLDQQQNAEFFLNLVRSLARPGGKIRFVEAGIGNAETPSPTNTLGAWAVVARWQAVLLFAVLVFTLGRRFGQPETERKSVQGSRELFDAIADVFRRSRNTGLALDNLLHECDVRMRRTLHEPSSLARSNMLQKVPVALREQYLNVSELAVSKCQPAVAAAAARRLLSLLEQFEGDSRSARGLSRR